MARLLDQFVNLGVGQRIETRRWWAKFDGDIYLDRMWHTLLAGLIIQFYTAGVDPWALAMSSLAENPYEQDEERKYFHFKRAACRF
eukprot:1113473-Pyramimonas_sp.AAC.1